jgi:hypothetical protein
MDNNHLRSRKLALLLLLAKYPGVIL